VALWKPVEAWVGRTKGEGEDGILVDEWEEEVRNWGVIVEERRRGFGQ
jgi:hypothetical protein